MIKNMGLVGVSFQAYVKCAISRAYILQRFICRNPLYLNCAFLFR